MNKDLKSYYSQRASEYEEVYQRDDIPGWREELQFIEDQVRRTFKNHRVLEIACGTGYWTQTLAEVAKHVIATDVSPEVLEVAGHKALLEDQVTFVNSDAYSLENVAGDFEGGLANFWFSHIPKDRIMAFLNNFHSKLQSSAVVLLCDGIQTSGLGGELVSKPDSEDTYKIRTLNNGTVHQVLKNYYSEQELRQIFEPIVSNLEIQMGKYFWRVRYSVR
jgi:ubiquinone/menaquinone biosynthesis C-methylase UbiE